MGISKSLGTHILENHLDNWFELFFGRALDQMGQKCKLWAKFGPKSIFCGGGVKLLVYSYQGIN